MLSATPHRSPSSPRCVAFSIFVAASCLAVLLASASASTAQSPAQQPATPSSAVPPPNTHPAPTFRQARHHLHPVPKQPLAAQTTAPVTQALVVPAPELPHWPANDHPAPAHVVWDSHGLRVDAANSSLSEILAEVSTLTGAHVDGFASDARVYGQYGPGPARDILSQLLEGTGYNVMMIGDLGQGAPRQIVLTTRSAAGAQPAARPTNSSDDDADVDEPAQQQPFPGQVPIRVPFNPANVRNPQQYPPDMQRLPGQPLQQLPPNQQLPPGQLPQQPNQQ
jgi:hypothetical protein